MKKVVSMVTALAFALGLAGAGLAQTAGKEAEKPAVKMETPASQPQVAPEKAKTDEPAAKVETKKSKQTKEAKKKAMRKGKKAADTPEHPAAPAAEPKQETK